MEGNAAHARYALGKVAKMPTIPATAAATPR